jgi:hypothetical protein
VQDVNLGPYENKLRAQLFENNDIGQAPYMPEVGLVRYRSKTFPIRGFYTLPQKHFIKGVRYYVFSLGGFRIIAKVDRRPTPQFLIPLTINGRQEMVGLIDDIERTKEFAGMADMVNRLTEAGHRWEI